MSEQEQPIDWQHVAKQFSESLSAITVQIGECFKAIQPAIIESVTYGLKVMQDLRDVMHTAYLEDGAIYGDTHAGMMRWMEERGEINRLRAEAERLEQYHEGMRQFKRVLAEHRAEEEQS